MYNFLCNREVYQGNQCIVTRISQLKGMGDSLNESSINSCSIIVDQYFMDLYRTVVLSYKSTECWVRIDRYPTAEENYLKQYHLINN